MIEKKGTCQHLLWQLKLGAGIIFASMQIAYAESEWQLGMGLGHLSSNAYIGSSDSISLTTPVPFITLKTDWFDLSDGNLTMKWFENTPFRLSFNFDLGLPVESAKVDLRQGMSDLDSILQVGPMLSYQLSNKSEVEWNIEAPWLFAYTVGGSSTDSTGWTFAPRIAMRWHIKKQKDPLDLEVSLGPVFGAKKYHQFYYSVAQADANLNRNAYDASSGYAGYRLNVSFTKRVDDIWFGLYLRYQNLSKASFSDSPLVGKNDFLLVTFAASWVFASSQ